MEKYLLKTKDEKGNVSKFTIPKENIKALAFIKAMDYKYNKPIKSDIDAIEFLNSIGIEVINC